MSITDPSEVLKRKINKKKKKPLEVEAMPEELKFCDGDSCEYKPYDAGNSVNNAC
jgi:hypothetical protein